MTDMSKCFWVHWLDYIAKVGPPLNSHLIIPSGPTFLPPLVNNDPFLLPSVFSPAHIRITLETVRPVAAFFLSLGCDCTDMRAYATIFPDHPSKTWRRGPAMTVVCTRCGLLTNTHFWFCQRFLTEPRGNVLHDRLPKMYGSVTSGRQLGPNWAALLCSPQTPLSATSQEICARSMQSENHQTLTKSIGEHHFA